MPELPEVELFKMYMDKTSLHKTIQKIKIKNPEILQNTDKRNLIDKLENQEIQYTRRHGKYLFIHLDNHYWMILHFGMTGKLVYFKKLEDAPRYDRVLIKFKDKNFLAFDDPRKFGKISLTANIDEFIKEKKLGPDVCNIDFKTFQNIITSRRGAIKTLLMNQHVLAGIGNIYSDEILYQTCIHPKTPSNHIDHKKIKEMYKIIKIVLKTAVERHINHEKLPKTFIIPQRIKNGRCPNSDTELKTMKISGRTAYYCPQCQIE